MLVSFLLQLSQFITAGNIAMGVWCLVVANFQMFCLYPPLPYTTPSLRGNSVIVTVKLSGIINMIEAGLNFCIRCIMVRVHKRVYN